MRDFMLIVDVARLWCACVDCVTEMEAENVDVMKREDACDGALPVLYTTVFFLLEVFWAIEAEGELIPTRYAVR